MKKANYIIKDIRLREVTGNVHASLYEILSDGTEELSMSATLEYIVLELQDKKNENIYFKNWKVS